MGHVSTPITMLRPEPSHDGLQPETKGAISLAWAPKGSFHHVGFVVKSIQDSVGGFTSLFNAAWDGKIFYDPNQEVRVAFLPGPNSADPLIELVEPVGERSPVYVFLKRGGGLHHLCYQVGDLEGQLEKSRAAGAVITRPPLPAVAFGGRRIAWVFTRNKLLIEYLES